MTSESHQAEAHDETEIDLTAAATAIALPTSGVHADVPVSELPSALTFQPPSPGGSSRHRPSAGVAEVPPESVEVVADAPIGTPLFSEEAVLAAAPPPWVPVEPVPAVDAAVVEQRRCELAPMVEVRAGLESRRSRVRR